MRIFADNLKQSSGEASSRLTTSTAASHTENHGPHYILRLQRTLGNRAVQRWLQTEALNLENNRGTAAQEATSTREHTQPSQAQAKASERVGAPHVVHDALRSLSRTGVRLQRQSYQDYGGALGYRPPPPRPPLPVSGSAQPGPGISFSWNGRSVSITANLQVHGPAASAAVAQQMRSTIERIWTASFSGGYAVRCTANITYRPPNVPENAGATQIEVMNNPGGQLGEVTHMWGPGARRMTYNLAGTRMNWSPAHEFGHLLGLRDAYTLTWGSWAASFIGLEQFIGTSTTPNRGYENNLMAVTGGRLENQNIIDLIERYSP